MAFDGGQKFCANCGQINWSRFGGNTCACKQPDFRYEQYEDYLIAERKRLLLQRPPLGIMPRYIHSERRIEEIQDAIVRFQNAGVAVPAEWYEEIREIERYLLTRIK